MRILKQLVDLLTTGDVDESPSRVGSHEYDDAMGFQVLHGPSVPGRHRPGWPKDRRMAMPVPKSYRATSSDRKAVWQDEPGSARGGTTIHGRGVKAVATASQQAIVSEAGEVSPLSKAGGHPTGEMETLSEVSTTPFTLALHKEVMTFIRSPNICCEFAFGESSDPEGWRHVHGHIPSGHYAAAVQTSLVRDLVFRLGGRVPTNRAL